MSPINFSQANFVFGPPPGYDESQVMRISAFVGEAKRGSLDGEKIVVVAWKPNDEDLKRLQAGAPIYLSCFGGLPPHSLNTTFEAASSFA
jgi:hypothetical protein